MAGIFDDLTKKYKAGNNGIKLLFINVGIYFLVSIFTIVVKLVTGSQADEILSQNFLALPASLEGIAHQPWTVITYMFTHFEFFHLLFNMLWLYGFSSLFLNFFTNKHLIGIYFFGGVLGGLVYVAAYNLFPFFDASRDGAMLVGASASVMALVFAVAAIAPNYRINLLFIGSISMKAMVLVTVLIDLLYLTGNNAGGHFAHLGGAMAGVLFALLYKRNIDSTGWIMRPIDHVLNWFKPRKKRKMKVKWQRPLNEQQYRDSKAKELSEIDGILEKIKKSGYESLSKEEKKRLFEAGSH